MRIFAFDSLAHAREMEAFAAAQGKSLRDAFAANATCGGLARKLEAGVTRQQVVTLRAQGESLRAAFSGKLLENRVTCADVGMPV